jgi:hypothetical protein
MIKNYKQFESLLDKLKGPTEEEIIKESLLEYDSEFYVYYTKNCDISEIKKVYNILFEKGFSIGGITDIDSLREEDINISFLLIKTIIKKISYASNTTSGITDNSNSLKSFLRHYGYDEFHIINGLPELKKIFKVVDIDNYTNNSSRLVYESLLDKLKGPSEEDMIKHLNTLDDSEKIKFIIRLGEEYYKYLPEKLIVNGKFSCSDKQLTSLPDNLTVNGEFWCSDNNLTSLPNNLTVNGFLCCSDNKITKLPESLIVGGDLMCDNNQLTSLPDNLVVNGDLGCSNNELTSLPENLVVNGVLWCRNNKLTSLPDNLTIKKELNCSNNRLTSLPDNLTINGDLDCSYNELTNLPNNLTVNGNLRCDFNQLTCLPNNLKVTGNFICYKNKTKIVRSKYAEIGGEMYQ